MQKYDVNQHLIETLLSWVKSGEIAIPEIQRPFVWDSSQVRDLLDSLYKGFPVGYIIVWKNPDIRLKDGSLSEGKKILIDGQQRITALSAALAGQKVITKEYKQVFIRIAFNPQKEIFEVTNPAIEKDKSWIPDIAPFMSGELSMLKLIKQYMALNPGLDEDALEKIFDQLSGITKKQVGVIVLAADLDIEMVTEIFIRINREGVALSQADFAMSKIAANETYGGNALRKAIDYFCHLAVAPEFFDHIEKNDKDFAKTDYFKGMRWLRKENDDLYDPSYNDMLRVAFLSQFSRGKLGDLVALLSGRNFETRKYEEEIASASFDKLKSGVSSFMNETNFKRFLMIIKDAGFINSSVITAQSPLNFAYALFLKLRSENYPSNEIESYVRRWYVFSLLTGRYSGQVETRFDQDIREIDEQGFGDYLAMMENSELGQSFWDAGLTRDLTTSNGRHPALMVYTASQVKKNARGFLSKDITVRSMLEHRGDIHHIFPKNYLKTEYDLSKSQYNQIANYVFVQQEINIAIGDQSPEKYMEIVLKQCETKKPVYGNIVDIDDLKLNLKENAIPLEFLNGGIKKYSDFLEARRKMIASSLKNYYAGL
jgi:hypothetical protein